jgi:hypothetical protein
MTPRTKHLPQLVLITVLMLPLFLQAQGSGYSAEPEISPAQIREMLNGRTVNVSDVNNSARNISWTFDRSELKEVDVIAATRQGNRVSVAINIRTGSAPGTCNGNPQMFVEGRLRLDLHYLAGTWTLTSVENLTMRYSASAYSGPSSSIPTYTPPPSAPRTISLVSPAFTVAPGNFSYFPFRVTNAGARITGWFRASGGRNDIQVLIIPAIEFENFRNRNQYRYIYDSGWVTVAQINIVPAPGDYYVIFNNVPAIVSNKAITANISLIE